jgi:hypothetical protein
MRWRSKVQHKLRLFGRRLPKSAAFRYEQGVWMRLRCLSNANTAEVETFAKATGQMDDFARRSYGDF